MATTDPPADRRCFWILQGQCHPDHGYIPSLVVEHEAGHSPMIGRGELAQPWYWGLDLAEARRICDQVNLDMFGLTPDETADIVATSMARQNRRDSARAKRRLDYARALGQQPNPMDRILASRLDPTS